MRKSEPQMEPARQIMRDNEIDRVSGRENKKESDRESKTNATETRE